MILVAQREYFDMALHKKFVKGDVYEEPNEKNANSLIKHGFAVQHEATIAEQKTPVKRARKSKKEHTEE